MKRNLLLSLTFSLLLAGAMMLTSCDDKAKKLQEQVDALTAEIDQIDSQKKAVEAQFDSISSEKEKLAEEAFAAKAFGEEQLSKLRNANQALVGARNANARLQADLDNWKKRADSLASENAELKAKVNDLNAKLAASEERAAAAERRAEAAEIKVLELQAKLGKTYFVSALNVEGTNDKGEKYSKERIKPGTDVLVLSVTLGRPEGQTASATSLSVTITDTKGANWWTGSINTTNDAGSVSIDVKGGKLDLNKGKYTILLKDSKDGTVKYNGFFTVS